MMRQRLKRWAELEPCECILMTDDTEHWYPGYRLSQYSEDKNAPPEWDIYFHANIQYAVQQAIEARSGWTWSLMKGTTGTYTARVWVDNVEFHLETSEVSSAEAFLSAYLTALESKKEKENV